MADPSEPQGADGADAVPGTTDPPTADGSTDSGSTANGSTANGSTAEPEHAPTPFDSPYFIPVILVGFCAYFWRDTYWVPLEEHLDFNFYGFKLLAVLSVWFVYRAVCEVRQLRIRPWVLPTLWGGMALWLGAEALGLLALPERIELPQLSLWGFGLCAALVPLTAWRELRYARRAAAPDAAES